ncbi:S26 family signal peptidase [Pseudoalteromonas sp. S186]|nr:S26 family signal peptidase [Pseudoalteromonas sp. S186]
MDEPERGDIVVFKFPGNESIEYIISTIGVPGV